LSPPATLVLLLALSVAPAARADAPTCDGRWREYPANLSTTGTTLEGAAVLNRKLAWAVGAQRVGGRQQPLLERWDGTAWSPVAVPDVPGSADLSDVDALSANDAWAVGRSFTSGTSAALAMHWEGSEWTVVPNPAPANSDLAGVSMAGPNDVWAVGVQIDGEGTIDTLIEHWDGSAWAVVPSPNPGPRFNELLGVSASSTVVAAGYRQNRYHSRLLLEQWDGTQWNVLPERRVGSLSGVWVRKGVEAWAAGPPAEHWDGSAWSVTPLPVESQLNGVSGRSATGVWTVGSRDTDTGGSLATILRWNGDHWIKAPSVPSPGTTENALLGVAASEPFVWAVGYRTSGSSVRSAFIVGVC
jgi:hypothetical protein